MIYGQKPPLKEQPKTEPVLSRQRLEFLLMQSELKDTVQDLIDKGKLPYRIEDGKLKDTLSAGELYLKSFITEDPKTLEMKEYAKKMALTDYEVLITGNTGTGKELVANSMIGSRMSNKDTIAPIMSVNCTAFPENLIESELFGHKQGAFTGATTATDGLLFSAGNGIMFLDEIGDLPLTVQGKLLRALQERRVRQVGSTVHREIKCKFVCATHRNLKKMVEDGLFRRDLYARISTLELHINPLKERLCDVIPITKSLKGGDNLIAEYGSQLEKGELDLSLNVRSIQQYVTRYNVLGKIVI